MNLKSLAKNPAVRGAISGAASQAASQFGALGPGLATAASGFLLKDQWAQEMGGFQLGSALAQGSDLPGVTGSAPRGALI